MECQWWEDVDEDGGQFIEAVEDKAVLPDEDGHHQHAHAEDVVGFVPGQAVGEQDGLQQHRDIHEVAEVEHEEVIVDCSVGGVSQKHQKYQGHLRKSLSTR